MPDCSNRIVIKIFPFFTLILGQCILYLVVLKISMFFSFIPGQCILYLVIAQEEETAYYPMLFSHDKPFEEFFCICIQLLNKTWREMRASMEDFPKVSVKGRGVGRGRGQGILGKEHLLFELMFLCFYVVKSF